MVYRGDQKEDFFLWMPSGIKKKNVKEVHAKNGT